MLHLVPLDKAKVVEMALAFHHHLQGDVSIMSMMRKPKKLPMLCSVRSLSTPYPLPFCLILVPPIVSPPKDLSKEAT